MQVPRIKSLDFDHAPNVSLWLLQAGHLVSGAASSTSGDPTGVKQQLPMELLGNVTKSQRAY